MSVQPPGHLASRHHAIAKNGRPDTTPIRDLCPLQPAYSANQSDYEVNMTSRIANSAVSTLYVYRREAY